jgi:hypothetical protein
MKKILYLIAGIFSLILSLVLGVLLIVFVDPTIVVNENNISWLLERSRILESWTWKKMEIAHEWKKWNERHLTGDIRDFCFRYRKEGTLAYNCFSEISWDFDLLFHFGDGFETRTYKPFLIHSPQTELTLSSKKEPAEESSPPDLRRWWNILWSGIIPDMDVQFDSISLTTDGSTRNFNFSLEKRERSLKAETMKIILTADPESFVIKGPAAIRIPEKVKTVGPYYIRDLTLSGKMKNDYIPLHLTGSVEEAAFDVKGILDLPLADDMKGPEFRREFLSTIKGEVRIPEFRKTFSRRAPAAFRELPAPFNVLDGMILMNFSVEKGEEQEVKIHSVTNIDLKSSKERVNLDVHVGADVPVMTFKPDEIEIELNFHEVKIELPKLSKKSPPPQFIPDKRFKKGPWKPPVEEGEGTDINFHLVALNRKSLHLRTNLLDEPVRLNFDLLIGDGEIKRGHITTLPLETEIFRRPIHLKKMVVKFQSPLEPVLSGTIVFPLPEYKITMEFEGPVSKPRYSFQSEPPLPQNDIYAVLLFGRPLQDLDPDDKTAAQKTNQILANGILSLSVLYFLAGSPVEYVGFDPDSKNATAQFGLGKKTSLRVGGGQEGMNSGIRHSLGKGWYIDTSVQNTEKRATEKGQDYGVLLERVIAY